MSRYEQGTPEWIEMRKEKITATDVAVILGKNPYKTPYKLWAEKMGFETPTVNNAMQFGKDNEEPARKRYIAATGHQVSPLVVEHPEYDWMMASLDGVTIDQMHAVEIKSIMSASKFGTPIPEYHKIQMDIQAACLGLITIDYVRDDGFDQEIINYRANEDIIDDNIDVLREFYRCIVTKTQPPLSDQDVVHRDDLDWISTMQRYLYLQDDVKRLQDELNCLKSHLIELSQGQPSQGGGGRLCKINRKGSIDYGKIEDLKNIDLEQYRKPDTEFWSIRSNGNTT